MRLDNLSKEEKADYQRRLAKGYGEIISLKWTDLIEGENEEEEVYEVEDKKGNVTKKPRSIRVRDVPVECVTEHYVGRLEPGQTGRIMTLMF